MMPDKHILYAFYFGLVLYATGSSLIPILVMIAASFLIDIDHALDYCFRFGDFNFSKASRYFRRSCKLSKSNNHLPVFIFHNIETILMVMILSIFYPLFIYITAGIMLHMILDWKVMKKHTYPFVIKFSLIMVLIENYRRRRGTPKW